jgi:hypothetical protein
MIRNLALALGLGMFLMAGISYAAVLPENTCKDSKLKFTGKKAFDLLKAYGKNIKKNPDTNLSKNVSKAESKFTKAFSKAESKGAGACLTSGDVGVIENKVDAFVLDVIAELSPSGAFIDASYGSLD